MVGGFSFADTDLMTYKELEELSILLHEYRTEEAEARKKAMNKK